MSFLIVACTLFLFAINSLTMPPKKRKTSNTTGSANSLSVAPTHMWLLKYKCSGNYDETELEMSLYSTKEKAIEAFPSFMDAHSEWGEDWKRGIKGLGQEDGDNYLGFECFVNKVKKKKGKGGVLLTNETCENDDSKVTVSVERILVNPPPP